MKTTFILSVFDVLLFEGSLVLESAKKIPGSKRFKVSFISFTHDKFFF